MSPDKGAGFQQQQRAFTAHIRDPALAPCPDGIAPERMAVYAELFFNGMDDQLSAGFPVLRAISSEDSWNALVGDFFARHRCSTPLFSEIGLEFLDYLEHEREPHKDDWPFMLELAHYEYVELAVSISDAEIPAHDPNGDLLAGHPIVSPTAWNLSYHYPVHRIGPDFLPRNPPADPTHLVVYRDRQDEVHFPEINPVTQRLLTLLKESPAQSGLDLLNRIADELQHAQPETVIHAGTRLLQEMHQRNIILGTATTQE